MESPAAILVPLKFDVIVLIFEPDPFDCGGGAGVEER